MLAEPTGKLAVTAHISHHHDSLSLPVACTTVAFPATLRRAKTSQDLLSLEEEFKNWRDRCPPESSRGISVPPTRRAQREI